MATRDTFMLFIFPVEMVQNPSQYLKHAFSLKILVHRPTLSLAEYSCVMMCDSVFLLKNAYEFNTTMLIVLDIFL